MFTLEDRHRSSVFLNLKVLFNVCHFLNRETPFSFFFLYSLFWGGGGGVFCKAEKMLKNQPTQ